MGGAGSSSATRVAELIAAASSRSFKYSLFLLGRGAGNACSGKPAGTAIGSLNEASLCPQSNERINFGGASRRDVRRKNCDRGKK